MESVFQLYPIIYRCLSPNAINLLHQDGIALSYQGPFVQFLKNNNDNNKLEANGWAGLYGMFSNFDIDFKNSTFKVAKQVTGGKK